MFTDDRRFISKNYTRDDYINLDLRLSSPSYIWNQAIEMMRDRIIGRYLRPMDVLIRADVNSNGFAAMALCSLLIETLMQFREGAVRTPPNNRNHYARFLKDQLGGVFTYRMGERFYSDIRCGILHSAQTKYGSCLTFGTNYVAKIFGNNVFMVDVCNMYSVIDEYFEGYCRDLRNAENQDLREKFIRKMNYITKRVPDTMKEPASRYYRPAA